MAPKVPKALKGMRGLRDPKVMLENKALKESQGQQDPKAAKALGDPKAILDPSVNLDSPDLREKPDQKGLAALKDWQVPLGRPGAKVTLEKSDQEGLEESQVLGVRLVTQDLLDQGVI